MDHDADKTNFLKEFLMVIYMPNRHGRPLLWVKTGFSAAILSFNVDWSGWNQAEVYYCTEDICGFNFTPIGAWTAAGQTKTTSFLLCLKCTITAVMYSGSPRPWRWQTHKYVGSGLWCRKKNIGSFQRLRNQSQKRRFSGILSIA